LKPAVRAKDIMTKNVFTIPETARLIDASMFMERVDHTTVPVVDQDGDVSGMISLGDIMKGRRHNKMQAPVKAYMSTPVVFAGSMATMREIERLFYKHKISRIPVVEKGKLLGVVTRWDYLQFQKQALRD
jgi:tRNA nucleotidyltransferase (CCA-adding enzyme)